MFPAERASQAPGRTRGLTAEAAGWALGGQGGRQRRKTPPPHPQQAVCRVSQQLPLPPPPLLLGQRRCKTDEGVFPNLPPQTPPPHDLGSPKVPLISCGETARQLPKCSSQKPAEFPATRFREEWGGWPLSIGCTSALGGPASSPDFPGSGILIVPGQQVG